MLLRRPPITNLIILLLILIFAVFVFLQINTKQKTTNSNTLPSIRFGNALEYEDAKSGGISIKTASGYCFTSNNTRQAFEVTNCDINKYAFILTIYLSDGTMICKTPLVSPGETLTEITLVQPLKTGRYGGVIFAYEFYTTDSEHKPVTRCECVTEIITHEESL